MSQMFKFFVLPAVLTLAAVAPPQLVACSLAGCLGNGVELRSSFIVKITHGDKPLAGVSVQIKTISRAAIPFPFMKKPRRAESRTFQNSHLVITGSPRSCWESWPAVNVFTSASMPRKRQRRNSVLNGVSSLPRLAKRPESCSTPSPAKRTTLCGISRTE